MTTKCPCCGQDVDTDDLMVSLDSNTASRNGHCIKLTPQLAVLAWMLNKARPRSVDHERLIDALHGKSSVMRTENPKLVTRVLFSQARRMLASLGVTIHAVHGEGYRMVVE